LSEKKGAKDKARAKVFAKLIRQVEVAAREGGGDINANATLRTMYAKARDSSVPLDTIERAIKRGTGELEGVRYESVTYEGYAPGGVALIVETLTDITAIAPVPRCEMYSAAMVDRWRNQGPCRGSSSAEAS